MMKLIHKEGCILLCGRLSPAGVKAALIGVDASSAKKTNVELDTPITALFGLDALAMSLLARKLCV